MSDDLSIEELIIDDSFANYCFQTNEVDILFWNEYILAYPSRKEKIEEARQIVLALRSMLKQEHDEGDSSLLKAVPHPGNKRIIPTIIRYAAAIAAIFIIVLAGKQLMYQDDSLQTASKDKAANIAATNLLLFKTASGEKKVIILPDSSKLYLNAGSELRVDKDFGILNRTVYLTGEALFDVTHNKSLPFIVHIDKYDVKVLGTLFNIKAYSADKMSETSLIRGRVEISLKNNSQKIILTPNQKVVIDNSKDSLVLKNGDQQYLPERNPVALLPLSYNSKDSMVIETAWTQNRLEIVNESFSDMKEKLERWYNIKINFKDAEVDDYTFTATFEKESIQEVLQVLQNAYHFNYIINENQIIISK